MIFFIIFFNKGRIKLDGLFFNQAIKKNTIESYNKYLKRWPNGIYFNEANDRIDDLEFENAIKNNTVDIWFKFFKHRLFEKYYQRAEQILTYDKLEPMVFAYSKKWNEIEDYEEYLKKYPHGNYKLIVNSLLDSCYYFKAIEDDFYSAFEQYLNKFPNGKYLEQSKKRLAWLKKQKAVVKVEYPEIVYAKRSPYSNVESPFFRLDVLFKEIGGKVGYKLESMNHNYYTPNGTWYIGSGSNTVTVKANDSTFYDTWWSGEKFCEGSCVINCYGKDAGGNYFNLTIRVKGTCKDYK